jgi:hypothetical protein
VARVGGVKTPARAGAGPVVLLHIKKGSTSIQKAQLWAALQPRQALHITRQLIGK